MNLKTKGDLVNAALRKLGIASNATLTDVEPQSTEDAVNDLESMMAEWYEDGNGIDVGYIFSADDVAPDPGDEHGLSIGHISAVFYNLATRISPDYAVEASGKVVAAARYGKELLVKSSAALKAKKAKAKAGYPNRMPIGSGNRLLTLNGHNYFHHGDEDNADDTTPAE